MIYVSENKALLCKGDYHPAELYKGEKKIAGYTVEEFSDEGSVTLENCYNDKIYDARLYGKNLFNVSKWFPDYVNDDGGITYSAGDFRTIYGVKILEGRFIENMQYTISLDYMVSALNNGVYIYIYHTDGTYVRDVTSIRTFDEENIVEKSGTVSLTSSSGKTVDYILFSYGTGARTANVELTNIQVEEGQAATEYEPPLADATITVQGKNILDMSKHTIYAGYYYSDGSGNRISNANFASLPPISVIPNAEYRFTSNVEIYSIWFSSSGGITATGNISKVKNNNFTAPDGCSYIKVSLRDPGTNFKWAMLEKGTGDGVYEPYIEPQTILLENGELAGNIPTFKGTTVIEVESDVAATISGNYKKVE